MAKKLSILSRAFALLVALGWSSAGFCADIDAAACRGNWGEVMTELKAKPSLAIEKDFHGFSLLHYAAMSGNKEAVGLLLKDGADLNARDILGWTPLDEAANLGHAGVVNLLIAAGADINPSNHGYTALWCAVRCGVTV
jgi:ankyrin repeat protein